MSSRFIHLHTHSHYSFLQALPKVPELVAAAKKNNMDALALTDAGNLHGAIEFYKTATKAGVKPIIGVDTYIAPRARFDKDPRLDAKRSRIVLLAENNVGYKNLLALVTQSFTEGFFERPRVDMELLGERRSGIIAIIPSFAGNMAQLIKAGDREGAAAALAEYVSIFDTKHLFLEISHHPKADRHTETMRALAELSRESGVPLVAQNDVYYLSPDDREATEVMRRIQHGAHSKYANEAEDFSFTTEKQMFEYFKEMPEAVDMSRTIADRCNVSFELGSWVFPDFPIPVGATHESELRSKVEAGIAWRGMKETATLRERIEYELDVIITKGFAPYFLVVSDLLNHAKEVGILTTTRGSAAGSLVSYLTGITNVDPIAYQLPFERFLNPERPKAPDIDMDYADTRRDEMIAYAKQKYGDDKVAQIGTFGTMMARAAVRDVARALGHPYGVGDRIAKLIPMGSQGFPMTITHAMELEEDLRTLYSEDDDVREILDIAKRIEGSARHTGVHAAGVVIAPTPLTEWTPVQPDPKGTEKLITQYDMHAVEDVGLLKYDFLGITNLSILADAIARVEADTGAHIDIETVPLDDTKTFTMLAAGETEGVFQLNGSGMTRYLKELKPTTIHDINAMVALYRPGPMETIPAYIERKHNPKLIRYLDERMKEYLDFSYGLLVYQDDVLLTAIKLGGYSWLEADVLRKAMGKKIPAEMAAQKEKLLKGFEEFGKLSKEKGQALWKLIEPFAAYGFNKAHAASYGRVAYQTAYMKANYPVEYLAALLTAGAGDTEEIATLVAECSRLAIPVLPPDVNESGAVFTVVSAPRDAKILEKSNGKAIRFGLSSIKNFGEGISEAILAERIARGPYETLADFLSRVGSKNLNRKSLESLIKCGALDRFEERGVLLANIESLLAFHREMTAAAPQDSLFGVLATPVALSLPTKAASSSLQDKLAWEKELLGIYVSGYPLDAYKEKTKKAGLSIGKILADPQPGLPIILPVLVADVRTILTKNGEKMAFVRFEDKTGSIEGAVFPKLFKEHAAHISPGTCLLVKGHISNRNGELSLALDAVKEL
ncbi:MAG: DNA polymerase III subunit alpha [Parcubacteria group bacterium 21-54-25]|nr:MAG: DNA polymerase III subunit alpha [Parcubacteria group bacterium 21-54-25]HQU08183.1 DNA polymerase III subunit alpha [Candidatus Paceibacterota bacterium]